MRKPIGCSGVVAAALLAFATHGAAETYYVATNGVDSRTGKGDWANAVKTISNALFKATTAGDIVLVSNGVYVLAAELKITNAVSVISTNGPDETVINGNYPTRTTRSVSLNHLRALLAGFTITNSSDNTGGGIRMDSGTVSNCIIRACTATYAGSGAAVFGADSLLVDSTIRDCYASYGAGSDGGAVHIADTGCVVRCGINNNSAARTGGGVCLQGTGGSLRGCTVASNTAVVIGGGIYCSVGTAGDISDCSIISNTAPSGGGIYFTSKGGCVLRCVINNNSASVGGAVCSQGNITLRDCTLNFNTAVTFGGGLNCPAGKTGDISNCSIISNIAQEGGGMYYVPAGLVSNCVIAGNSATNRAGGLCAHQSYSTRFVGCVFRDNAATNAGGAYRPENGGTVESIWERCLIQNNHAWKGDAGGVMAQCPQAFYNCLFVSNTAPNAVAGSGRGGGLVVWNCNSFVRNCSFVANTAYEGGGIYLYRASPYKTNTFVNTISYFNIGGTTSNLGPSSVATNFMPFFNCILGTAINLPGADNLAADPGFADVSGGDFRLKKASPAVDSGLYAEGMETELDMDGRRRLDVLFRRVDRGAYEYIQSGMMFFLH